MELHFSMTHEKQVRGETHIYISQGAVELLKNNGKHTCIDRQGQAKSWSVVAFAMTKRQKDTQTYRHRRRRHTQEETERHTRPAGSVLVD